jgi:hypothetical protein
MGWACTNCGDVNPGVLAKCEECGTAQGAKVPMRVGLQPIGPGLIWLATLFGGVLAGYALALWNGRVLRNHGPLTTIVYAAIGIGGWILTIVIIANFTAPENGEPGFGIPVALALGFLLVSIPYNLDTLAVNQWIWTHPGRKLVINVGGTQSGLAYTSFADAQGELFGTQAGDRQLLSIPVVPVAVIVVGLAIGVATVTLGNLLAPK